MVCRIMTLLALGIIAGAIHSMFVPVKVGFQPDSGVTVRPAVPSPKAGPEASKDPGAATQTASQPASEAAPADFKLTIAQAKKFFDEGAPFIDGRPDAEYRLGTIPGSRHITPARFSEPASQELLQFMDPGQPVVIFCGGGDCHDSETLAIFFQEAGYKRIYIVTDGFPGWTAAGYEVEVPQAEPKP